MKKLLLGLCVLVGIMVNGSTVDANEYYTYANEEYQWATVDAEYNYKDAYELLELVNDYREENGLSRLETNDTLMKIAMQRALESNVLFEHKSPYGGSHKLGAAYKVGAISSITDTTYMFGEVMNTRSGAPAFVLKAFQNSTGHNKFLLQKDQYSNINAKAIGVGVVNQTTVVCYFYKEAALAADVNTTLTNYTKVESVPVLKSLVDSGAVYKNDYVTYGDSNIEEDEEDTEEETVSEADKVKATKVKLNSVSKKRSGNNTRLTIKFTKTKKLSGVKYQVRVYKDKKCTKVLKSKKTTKSQWTVKINNKKYKKVYVKVRCYKKVDGKTVYGKWSKVKTVKTR